MLIGFKRGLLDDIEQTPASDVDNAMLKTAELALSIRSDDAPRFVLVELDPTLADRVDALRSEIEAAAAGNRDAESVSKALESSGWGDRPGISAVAP